MSHSIAVFQHWECNIMPNVAQHSQTNLWQQSFHDKENNTGVENTWGNMGWNAQGKCRAWCTKLPSRHPTVLYRNVGSHAFAQWHWKAIILFDPFFDNLYHFELFPICWTTNLHSLMGQSFYRKCNEMTTKIKASRIMRKRCPFLIFIVFDWFESALLMSSFLRPFSWFVDRHFSVPVHIEIYPTYDISVWKINVLAFLSSPV